jgi:hypothetical protein
LCDEAGVPAVTIGRTGGSGLEVSGLFSVTLAELGDAYRSALQAIFG